MEYYDRDLLQNIQENVNLLEYVSQHIDLVQKGNDYFGHCPKHIDNTPSFSITPLKNAFYCFSCGRAGGIINYLKEYEDLSFAEAVEKASKLANIDLSKLCQSQTISFLKNLKNCISNKADVCQHRILDKTILNKFDKEIIDEWEAEGMDRKVLELFDVRIDDWGNRIVYPVYDIDKNLINIKGRTRYPNFKELGIPKYINYYPVGIMDYFQGLDITLPYIQNKNEIIIFESIKSVIKAYGWGYLNCVSAEKHTLTRQQLELIIKLKTNVVFAYDTDVDYNSSDVKRDIDILRRITNVYLINDTNKLLGGKETKNAPVDCGEDVWNELYNTKKKVV